MTRDTSALHSRAIHHAIMQAWECALADTYVIYLSGPITTGPRLLSGQETDTTELVRENCLEILKTAAQLRRNRRSVVVEPASLNIKEWSQSDYLDLWERFIERHVDLMVFMPGWEFSAGCTTEFARAIRHDIRTEDLSGARINAFDGRKLIEDAIKQIDDCGPANNKRLADLQATLHRVLNELRKGTSSPATVKREGLQKDAALDILADRLNVAQFVSYRPANGKPKQSFCRIANQPPNREFSSLHEAIDVLLRSSSDNSVNVRSYEPHDPRSREFIYGLKNAEDVAGAINRLTAEGLHTIVNETIDIHDGGVSGVLMGDTIEFAPDDTPRCVEKPGTANLPRDWGRSLLSTVYGVPLRFDTPLHSRLEFSIHPRPRGWQHNNLLAWEFEEDTLTAESVQPRWPNNFSRMLGDKVYGLLVAYHIGLPVPKTTVINRRIAPFSFGDATGNYETWIRTAPYEQVPGKYSTFRGWRDPFTLMIEEDPNGQEIASHISQAGVFPEYAGALIVSKEGAPIIEGVKGDGQMLMLGTRAPEALPSKVTNDVLELYSRAEAAIGPVRMEWVHDGKRPWIVQFHSGATDSVESQITSMTAENWQLFDIDAGLEALRKTVANLPEGTGITLSGRVGLTSHFADLLRKANVPARMVG